MKKLILLLATAIAVQAQPVLKLSPFARGVLTDTTSNAWLQSLGVVGISNASQFVASQGGIGTNVTLQSPALTGPNAALAWLKSDPVHSSASAMLSLIPVPAVVSNFATANFDNTGIVYDEGEGYCSDGTNHFVAFHQGELLKFTNDAVWNSGSGVTLIASNMSALKGLTGVNHIGGIKYFGGMVWAVIETYNGVGDYSGQQIVRFNATTLALIDTHSIASSGHEASDLAIIPDAGLNGLIAVSSYDVPPAAEASQLSVFDLSSFTFLGYINLSAPISYMQGVAYNPYDGRLYIDGNGIAWGGDIHCVGLNGTNYGTLWSMPGGGTGPGQGIDIVNNTIHLLYDRDNVGSALIVYLGLNNPATATIGASGALSLGNGAIIPTSTNVAWEYNLMHVIDAPPNTFGNGTRFDAFRFQNTNSGSVTYGHIGKDVNSTMIGDNITYGGVWYADNTNYPMLMVMFSENSGQVRIRTAAPSWANGWGQAGASLITHNIQDEYGNSDWLFAPASGGIYTAGTAALSNAAAFLAATPANTNLQTISTSVSLNFGTIAAQASKILTFTLTGADTAGDWTLAQTPDSVTMGSATNIAFTAWVSAANTVSVMANNTSAFAQTLGNGHVRLTAMQWKN